MSNLTNVQRLVGEAMDAHQRWEKEKERALEAVDVAQIALGEVVRTDGVADLDELDQLDRTLNAMKNDIQGFHHPW